jgi:hypothetical protein
MVHQTLPSLFTLANNFGLEIMALLAVIWIGTLGYVIVRKIVGLVKRHRRAPVGTEAQGSLA